MRKMRYYPSGDFQKQVLLTAWLLHLSKFTQTRARFVRARSIARVKGTHSSASRPSASHTMDCCGLVVFDIESHLQYEAPAVIPGAQVTGWWPQAT